MQRILPGLIALTALSATGWSVDLTPHFVTRMTAARSERLPFFREGETRYSLQPPAGASVSGGDGETVFHLNHLDGATVVLRNSPFQPSLAFAGPSLETYRKALPQFLPRQAGAVEVQDEKTLEINGWSSLALTMTYKLPGRAFKQAVIFLNYSESQQFALTIAAPAEHFAEAQALSLRMMRTWRTLLPGENLEVPPPL